MIEKGSDEDIQRLYDEMEQERYYAELERQWRKDLFPIHRAYVKEYKRSHKNWVDLMSPKGLTDYDIENARHYPIEQIVEVNKQGYALCVAHSDTNPSMYCKKNYAYCFTCGYSADAIKLYRDVNEVNFNQAIKELCNI